MIYSAWAGDGPSVSRLGFGCTRFPQKDLSDKAGIARCVQLVEYALEMGINYFDTAPTYANGHAEQILGAAFQHSGRPIFVAAKSGLTIDRTANELLKRIDTSLSALHRDRIDFFHIWSVMDWEQYCEILKRGGLYEGAKKAQELGLIDRLCISLHCDIPDVLKIIQEGLFDGITISINAMNYKKWLPVLKAAKAQHMGIATMNSLGGGMIPSYARLFEKLDESSDSTAIKALRFLASFPEIDVLLSGMATKAQIAENCSAFQSSAPPQINYGFSVAVNETLCSGCNYCAPCVKGIPVSACMQAYNHKILIEAHGTQLSQQEIANQVFTRLRANGAGLVSLDACVACGACEQRCTQKIRITERIRQLRDWAETYHYTAAAMRKRLQELEDTCRSFQRIAIWPSCDYVDRVFNFWKNPSFERRCEYFNSSQALWGTKFRGKTVHCLTELPTLQIEAIVIMNYRLQDEIYNSLTSSIPSNLPMIKLHSKEDINWFDWFDRF